MSCIKDDKFYDRMKDIILYKTINGEFKTFSELPKTEGNKVYYVSSTDVQAQYIKLFKDNGLDAVILEHNIDTHYITYLEYKEQDIKFVRIDSETDEALKSDEGDKTAEADSEKVIEIFKNSLSEDKLEIKAQALKTADTPAIITINEYQRRLNDMNKMYGNMFGGMNDKAQETLIINTANSIIGKLTEFDEEKQKLICRQIYDLAVISQRRLSADELEKFVADSVKLMSLM